ncbi:MAG TPA: hypothetical protein VIR54_11705 [Vicinamibacterales bacterium]
MRPESFLILKTIESLGSHHVRRHQQGRPHHDPLDAVAYWNL